MAKRFMSRLFIKDGSIFCLEEQNKKDSDR